MEATTTADAAQPSEDDALHLDEVRADVEQQDDFDFAETTSSDTPVVMEVINPRTGAVAMRGGKPLTVKVWGPDTERMRLFELALSDRRLRLFERDRKEKPRSAIIERERLERVVHCIAAWDNFTIGGVETPYSEKAVRDFATKFPWFRDQVDNFYQMRPNFFPQTTTSSTG